MQTRLARHRLAGRAFALAARSTAIWLEAVRHRRRLREGSRAARRSSTAFLRGLGERGYVGANVTLPHKEAALAAADVADEAARRDRRGQHALARRAGRLAATNTDAYGFMTHLDAAGAGLERRTAAGVVLGAGGAARAIVHGPARGWRREDPARQPHAWPRRELWPTTSAPVVSTSIAWDERTAALAGCGLLVNTTSLGMTGQAAARHRSRRAPSRRRGRRHRLRAARDAAPGGGARRAAIAPSMGSACCCIRPCRASSAGSACGRR